MWLREMMLYSPKYPAMAREVGCYLAARMSEKRPYTWPSQARIAADLGRKRETVNVALMYLRRDGRITATTDKLGDDAEKDPRQLTYQLRLPYDPVSEDMSVKRDIRMSAKRDTI